MKAKKRNKILAILAIAEILALMGLGIYAWIEGGTSPQMEAKNLKITSSPGLIMLLNNIPEQTIDINEYIHETTTDFRMAEASSPDGVKIFIRDDTYNPNTADDETIYVRNANDTQDLYRTYIRFSFDMRGEFDSEEDAQAGRKVWFDDDTNITDVNGSPILPIRVSLTYSINGGAETTLIFSEERDDQLADPAPTYIPSSGYVTYYPVIAFNSAHLATFADSANKLTYDPSAAASNRVYTFSDYGDSNHPLFTLTGGDECTMTVRIWLEGTDPLCVDNPVFGPDVADNIFNLLLRFTTIDE